MRPHTKFQLVWAINNVFTRGGAESAPPSLKCVAGTPSLLGLINGHKSVKALVFPPNIVFSIVKYYQTSLACLTGLLSPVFEQITII